MKLTVVHAPDIDFEISHESSIFAPRDCVYLVPDKIDFGYFVRSMYELEKERNEWIRRYENVLTGLKYWRSKALEK